MSSWKPQSHADAGQTEPTVALPVPPAASAAPPVAGASSASPGTSGQPSVQTQAFSHQQAPVLPPPSAIGNGMSPFFSCPSSVPGQTRILTTPAPPTFPFPPPAGQSHMYQFPPLSNLNNLPRYNIPGNSNPGLGQTQLPSFNSISKGVNSVGNNLQANITLPPANQLLNSPNGQSSAEHLPNHLDNGSIAASQSPVREQAGSRLPSVSDAAAAAAAAAAVDDQKGNPNYKPLNVKDALYYLDQVKLQFRNQTDVYNNFLDIMKDFKSQNIDTPGVIERVSSLFKGHPKLIDGFNTFLPQGFSIECSTSDVNTIIVTTPLGTSIRRNSATSLPSASEAQPLSAATNSAADQHLASQDDKNNDVTKSDISTQMPASGASANHYPDGFPQQRGVPSQYPYMENNNGNVNGNTDGNTNGNTTDNTNTIVQQQPPFNAPEQQAAPAADQQAESKQSTPAEFDQAINYVNKIKQRYASQPDIYKLFLENLQMYQKGLKPINEVYREISVLFRDAPDLLEDFKLFMPDNTIVKDVQQSEYPYPQYYPQTVQLPPVGNFQSAPYPNGQHDMNNIHNPSQMILNQQQYPMQQHPAQSTQQDQLMNQGPDAQAAAEQYPQYAQQQFQPQQYPSQPLQQQQQPLQQQQQQLQSQQQPPQFQQDAHLAAKDRKKKGSVSGVSQIQTVQKQGQLQPSDEFPVSNLRGAPLEQHQIQQLHEKPALISGVLEPVYPKTLDTDLSNELAFFDKVKKAIGNKQTYNEFLKLLKLYSSDVIDKSTLHDKARTMIGGFPELFEWFKNFIGWEEKPLRIENIAIKKQQLDLMMCKAAGPSYRQLPKSQTKMPCSGRDDLCWSVFNDEWVGHPVWASEESGFIAHRKNQYEEMLFRIEDERHEYDYYMEANLRTIQTLETIANRIANMTPEEKARFKLPIGLGHTSSTIYVKVIRKIYDKDRGWEVIDALHENPTVTVLIVLKRLKQKDEEWKRAHREWNKVWREAEQKLMIKSLDHLGLSFKNIDKKLLTNKQLVSEISTIKQEQVNKKLHPLMTRPKSELITMYEDFSIFMDILKLVNTNLKHNQVYSQNDKERMETFMRSFMVKFFFMDPQYIEDQLTKRGIVSVNEDNDTAEDSNKEEINTKSIPTLSQTKKRPREYDLLRDVLRKNKRRKNELQGQQQSNSTNDQETGEDEQVPDEIQKVQSNWISNETFNSTDNKAREEYNMFANTQIYVFYRHLDTLYKRLLEIKKIAPSVNKEIKSRLPTKFASDLGLIDHHLEDLGVSIKGSDSYSEALELCVKLIDNKLEQSTFEEALRNGFRNKAFKLFTIDRVIQSLMKHCHTIVSDSKCSEILLLMEKDRNQPKTSTKDQILYRIQVRNYMNLDENMFKITYNKALSATTITFLALEDLTIKDESQDKEGKWNYYLTSYSMSHPTEGLDSTKIRLPFLKSQLENEQEDENEIEGVADSKLSVKIDMDTYRMRFEPESYDLFIRNSLYSKKPTSKKNRQIRLDKLVDVVNGDYGIAADLKEDGLKLANEKLEILKAEGPEKYLKFSMAPQAEQVKKNNEGKEEVGSEATAISTEKQGEPNGQKEETTEEESKETKEKNGEKVEEGSDKSSITNPQSRETAATEVTILEGDSTIQQDETVEKVDI